MSDLILKSRVKILLHCGIPVHAAISDFVKSVLPPFHHFNGEVIRGPVIEKPVEMLNVLFRVHIDIVFRKQQQGRAFNGFKHLIIVVICNQAQCDIV